MVKKISWPDSFCCDSQLSSVDTQFIHSGWNFLVEKSPHYDKVSSIEGKWLCVWILLLPQNLMVMSTFSCVRKEKPFSVIFGLQIQNCLFKVKFSTQTNSNIQITIVMLTFLVLDWKYLVCALFFLKIVEIIYGSKNFVPSLIWIC